LPKVTTSQNSVQKNGVCEKNFITNVLAESALLIFEIQKVFAGSKYRAQINERVTTTEFVKKQKNK